MALVALLLSVNPGVQAQTEEPMYTYQRVHTLIAHHDNRITLRIWGDRQLEMRFPPYTPQAGEHRRQISQAEFERLEQLLAPFLQVDPMIIEQARIAQGDGTVTAIADADLVRFSARLPGRNAVDFLIESPAAWSRVLPGARGLADLAEAERQLLEWMRRNRQEGDP